MIDGAPGFAEVATGSGGGQFNACQNGTTGPVHRRCSGHERMSGGQEAAGPTGLPATQMRFWHIGTIGVALCNTYDVIVPGQSWWLHPLSPLPRPCHQSMRP